MPPGARRWQNAVNQFWILRSFEHFWSQKCCTQVAGFQTMFYVEHNVLYPIPKEHISPDDEYDKQRKSNASVRNEGKRIEARALG